jgi:hypothetical protein
LARSSLVEAVVRGVAVVSGASEAVAVGLGAADATSFGVSFGSFFSGVLAAAAADGFGVEVAVLTAFTVATFCSVSAPSLVTFSACSDRPSVSTQPVSGRPAPHGASDAILGKLYKMQSAHTGATLTETHPARDGGMSAVI